MTAMYSGESLGAKTGLILLALAHPAWAIAAGRKRVRYVQVAVWYAKYLEVEGRRRVDGCQQ